jgi:hypothetical protein
MKRGLLRIQCWHIRTYIVGTKRELFGLKRLTLLASLERRDAPPWVLTDEGLLFSGSLLFSASRKEVFFLPWNLYLVNPGPCCKNNRFVLKSVLSTYVQISFFKFPSSAKRALIACFVEKKMLQVVT